MKHLIAIAAAFLVANAVFADDSYLYWMLEPEATTASQWNNGWTWMRIMAVDSNGAPTQYLNIYPDTSSTATHEGNYVGGNMGDGMASDNYAAALGTAVGSTWTYFLELYNADKGWLGVSDGGLAYNEAGEYIGVADVYAPAKIFNFGSMGVSSVPEPNSAMLFLLGLAALGLRRKAKKA